MALPDTRLSLLAVAIGMLSAAAVSAQHVLLPFSQHRDVALSAHASERGALRGPDGYAYVIDAAVGTPPQNLSLLISTTTSHTWVPDANTRECSPRWYYHKYYHDDYYYYDDDDEDDDYDDSDSRCRWGSFNASLSSTYLPPNTRYENFRASYPDPSYVTGRNMTDRLAFAGVELDDYPMGLVSSADRWLGVLGLGLNSSLAYSTAPYLSGLYDNVMDRMVSSGKIASPAYSIWLDDARASSGSLLFGAVDRSRYSGDLVRLSTSYHSYAWKYGYSVTLNAISGTSPSGAPMPAIRTNAFPLSVILGHGEVFSYLPGSLADHMAAMVGATYNKSLEYFTIPCDAGERNNSRFAFELGSDGGPKLNVETADLVQPSVVYTDLVPDGSPLESGTCFFAIQKYGNDQSLHNPSIYLHTLGGSILRRTYVVYDLANHEIAVAPVKFPSGGSTPTPEIKAFATYGAYTPGASKFCTSRSCRSSSGGSGSDDGEGFDRWKKIAIAVGISFGAVVLVGAVTGIILCRRAGRGHRAAAKEAGGASLAGSTMPAWPTRGVR
ncbi:hypothetical protein VTH06DRAFT_7556 [Thermothelomyces fergusii]